MVRPDKGIKTVGKYVVSNKDIGKSKDEPCVPKDTVGLVTKVSVEQGYYDKKHPGVAKNYTVFNIVFLLRDGTTLRRSRVGVDSVDYVG